MEWTGSFYIQLNFFLLKIQGSIESGLVLFIRETPPLGNEKTPFPITLLDFRSASNRCRDILQQTERAFTKKKCSNFLGPPTDKNFWFLAKNISNNIWNLTSLIHSDRLIANFPFEKDNLFGLLFLSSSIRGVLVTLILLIFSYVYNSSVYA